jgi:signal transduction histidine kinase
LSLSFVSWFIAEQLWMLYDYVFNIDPWPSVADIFYAAAPVLMLISLTVFLKPLKNKISKKNIIVAVFFSSLLLIPTAIITYQDNEDATVIELFLLIIYPVSDALVLIPTIIIISLLFSDKKNSFWIMILLGIIVLIAADTLYLFLVLEEKYHDNHPVDLLWLVSYTVWIFTLLRSTHNSKKIDSENIDIENYKKYETQFLSRYGIVAVLIIINVLVILVLFSIHYLLSTQPDLEFLEFFTVFLVMMMMMFSVMIILLNKSMCKNLETRTEELKSTTEELVKTERFSAIGTLASRLAHDLRNPLGIIVTSNSIIKKKATNEQILKNTEYISRSVDRMEHQISNVLDFVRVKPLKIKKISVQELIDDCLKGIKIPKDIVIKTPEKDIKINVDEEQFLIVMYNVVFNAVQKLVDKGSITITVESNDHENIIKIQDSGEAIPENIIKKIFEPLFTTKHQGTGLGLASCKQIIEEHKGTIHAENNPTSFIIKIPKEVN